MACCCVTTDSSFEPTDLPAEPEQSDPGRLSHIGHKPSGARNPIAELKELGLSPHTEMTLGAVTIPGHASQGLELLHSQKANLLVICGVLPGPWEAWNQSHPDNLVEPGDRILAVNSKSEHDAAKAEISSKSAKTRHITLHIRKAVKNYIRVTKEQGDTMGMVLIPLENGLLFIDSIAPDGLIAAWNIENPDNPVRMLDMIVEVNGVRGHHDALIKAMAEGGDMEFVLMTHVD